MSEPLVAATGRPVGARDIPLVLLRPRRFFARVEDVAVWGWSLVVLLTAVTLIGYATVQSGLIDREVDHRVQQRIDEIDKTQRDVVERSALRELYEQQRKQGAFEKLLTRIQVVVAAPIKTLATVLLIAAVLYGVVALTGRKPEWHTLLTICVFAAFIDVMRLLMQLALRMHYRTLDVHTSLAPLGRLLAATDEADPTTVAALTGLLTAVDPFRIWFWLIVIAGLSATAQLRGWRSWLVCGLCWLVGAGVNCALEVAKASA